MLGFIFSLLFFISSLNSCSSMSAVCVDIIQHLAINTNCSDFRIFKLNENLCDSEFKLIDIDPHETYKFLWLDHGKPGYPIAQFTPEQMKEFPTIHKAMTEICPNWYIKTQKISRFLSTVDDREVALGLYDARNLTGNTGIYQDFFNKAPLVKEFKFKDDDFSLTMKDLNQYFNIFNDQAEYTIYAAKSYSQWSAWEPIDVIQDENSMARDDLYHHTPDMFTYFKYNILHIPFPPWDAFVVYHGLLEVCLSNDKDDNTYHFLIDRVAEAYDSNLDTPFNSMIRITYIGEGDGCGLDSDKWAHVKDGTCYLLLNPYPCLSARSGKINVNYSMNEMIKITTRFLKKFRIFNTLFNCQHFASNAYDMITREKLDFECAEVMQAHAIFSGIDPILPWID